MQTGSRERCSPLRVRLLTGKGRFFMKENSKLRVLLFAAALALCLIPAVGFSRSASTERPPAAASSDETAASVKETTNTAAQLGSLKEFTAATLEGGSFTQDDLAGADLTILNFWTTTCGPCIHEMPELAAFEKELPDRVRLITVCLDGLGDEEYAAGILRDAGFEGLTLTSGDGDFLDLCRNLIYTPTTLLVDAEGNLVGDAIIGAQADLEQVYLDAVNAALEAAGKEAVSLA